MADPNAKSPTYVHLRPGEDPPTVAPQSYRIVIIAEASGSDDWREEIAEWIWQIGSRYVVAWGQLCEAWHDSVDFANLAAFDFGDVPDKDHIMTTWHSDEPLSEAFWFAEFCAYHPDVQLVDTILLHIAEEERKGPMLETYRLALISD